MEPVVGIFSSRSEATGAALALRSQGFPPDRVQLLLSPGSHPEDVVPTEDAEQPGVGQAIGGVSKARRRLGRLGLGARSRPPGSRSARSPPSGSRRGVFVRRGRRRAPSGAARGENPQGVPKAEAFSTRTRPPVPQVFVLRIRGEADAARQSWTRRRIAWTRGEAVVGLRTPRRPL